MIGTTIEQYDVIEQLEPDEPDAYLFPLLNGYNVSTPRSMIDAIGSNPIW